MCRLLGIERKNDKQEFFRSLSDKLGIKYETLCKYSFNGVPQFYVENRFPEFFDAIVRAVEIYTRRDDISKSLRDKVNKNWQNNKIAILSEFVDLWDDLHKKSWMKFVDNERYNSDLVLLDFMSGRWPNTIDGSLTKEEAEQLRRALTPHLRYLIKMSCTNESKEISEFRRNWADMQWEHYTKQLNGEAE